MQEGLDSSGFIVILDDIFEGFKTLAAIWGFAAGAGRIGLRDR